MKLIVGLGNPGNKYLYTRHNIGFLAVDYISYGLRINVDTLKKDSLFGTASYNNEDIILLKPQTYMNNSGESVLYMMEKFDIPVENILVLVDDFNIPLGSVRIRPGGSDGGHNGLSSIAYHLQTEEFPRMRLGIGKDEPILKSEFIDFVLGNFTETEFDTIKKLMPVYDECVKAFITEGIKFTMNKFNKNFIN